MRNRATLHPGRVGVYFRAMNFAMLDSSQLLGYGILAAVGIVAFFLIVFGNFGASKSAPAEAHEIDPEKAEIERRLSERIQPEDRQRAEFERKAAAEQAGKKRAGAVEILGTAGGVRGIRQGEGPRSCGSPVRGFARHSRRSEALYVFLAGRRSNG